MFCFDAFGFSQESNSFVFAAKGQWAHQRLEQHHTHQELIFCFGSFYFFCIVFCFWSNQTNNNVCFVLLFNWKITETESMSTTNCSFWCPTQLAINQALQKFCLWNFLTQQKRNWFSTSNDKQRIKEKLDWAPQIWWVVRFLLVTTSPFILRARLSKLNNTTTTATTITTTTIFKEQRTVTPSNFLL